VEKGNTVEADMLLLEVLVSISLDAMLNKAS